MIGISGSLNSSAAAVQNLECTVRFKKRLKSPRLAEKNFLRSEKVMNWTQPIRD